MSRPRFLFRPNLQKEDHRRAWETLQTVPQGQRSTFLVQAILKSSETELLRQIIREELSAGSIQQSPKADAAEQKAVPDGMLNFLEHLLEDEKE